MRTLEAGSKGDRAPAFPPGGFTLLELLVVIAIIAVASAGVGFALRDPATEALDRDAQRLTMLLESARAQSRALGVPVRWRLTEQGFEFQGLPDGALPTRWLDPSTTVHSGTIAPSLLLGPEPIIGPQSVVVSSTGPSGRSLRVATDGLRPFAVLPGATP